MKSLMNFHLKPATQEKLEAYAAMPGVSLDDCLEALVERVLPEDERNVSAPEATDTQFLKEHGMSYTAQAFPCLPRWRKTPFETSVCKAKGTFSEASQSECGTPLP